MAYSKQTWDTTSYVNPTRMNHIEQGIYDASTADGTEYSSGVSVKDKIDRIASNWTSLGSAGMGETVNISNTDYDVYSCTVVVSSLSPNLYFVFSIDRGNLSSNEVKFLQGSWATGNYGQAIEIIGTTSGIKLNSAYVNGSQITSSIRMYVSGRYFR